MGLNTGYLFTKALTAQCPKTFRERRNKRKKRYCCPPRASLLVQGLSQTRDLGQTEQCAAWACRATVGEAVCGAGLGHPHPVEMLAEWLLRVCRCCSKVCATLNLQATLKRYQTEHRNKLDSLEKSQAELKKIRRKSQGGRNALKYEHKEFEVSLALLDFVGDQFTGKLAYLIQSLLYPWTCVALKVKKSIWTWMSWRLWSFPS